MGFALDAFVKKCYAASQALCVC